MNKEALLYYSHKYQGEYDRIVQAINNKEPYHCVNIQNVFTIYDEVYPKQWKRLPNKPFVVYYRGNLNLLKQDALAIVGSRIIDDEIKNDFISFLQSVNKKFCSVSGLAKGIDSLAHRYIASGKTIAILAHGFDCCYPKENQELLQKIAKNGLLLTEYPIGTKPLRHHFPMRNRLVVGLSEKLIIGHIKQNSGTMISVNLALELANEIYVKSSTWSQSKDCFNNQLIAEGASILLADDFK